MLGFAACKTPQKATTAVAVKTPATASRLSGDEKRNFDALFWQAEKYKLIENVDSAIMVYGQLEKIDPQNHNILFQLGQLYLQKNSTALALDYARKAVALDATNPWYLDLECSIFMRLGNLKEAVAAFDKKIKLFPEDPDAYLNQAFLYLQLNDLNKAVEVYNAFEKRFGVDESVSLQKQKIFLKQNKFNEALAELHKLAEAFPGEVEYLRMEADLYSANGMKEKAVAVYRKILELEPDNPSALLAIAEVESNGNPDARIESLRRIFANPKVGVDTKIQVLMPYLQFFEVQKDKHEEAFELSALLLQSHPTEAKAYAVRGDLFYLSEKPDSALPYYLSALTFTKEVYTVWQQVVLIYNEKQDYTKLYAICREALEYFPNQAFLYLFKGSAENHDKKYDAAVNSYKKGLKLAASNNKMEAQFLANLGDTYHSMNLIALSDSSYEASLKLDPENAYVLNNYSYYLSIRNKDLEKAREMAAYANKLMPGNESFLDTYAWILFRLGKYNDAREWQEKALKATDQPNATLFEHYGDILFKLGESAKALEYWQKAMAAGSDSPTLGQKIAEKKYVE